MIGNTHFGYTTPDMKAIGLIPARFASTRFPGKPLAKILGKSLIQRTYERAILCKELSKVVVATDDKRIFEHVKGFGGDVVFTSPDCANGTERIFEVVNNHLEYGKYDIIVNVQGDEPCLNPDVITQMVRKLENDKEAVVVTPITLLKDSASLTKPSIVKCVKSLNDRALYFSRAPIPYGIATYYKHIGLYAYRKDFLRQYASWSDTPLQMTEGLEQLKILEHGFQIAVVLVEDSGIEVNEPEDIQKVEKYLCLQNLSL